MYCPFCNNSDTQVKDSRTTEDGAAIRRRRYCPKCSSRFTTFERIQLRELTVTKKDGRVKPFDREKLIKSISLACRKLPITEQQIEQAVNNIVRNLESLGEPSVTTDQIGQSVMDILAKIDPVAYVRFASVYKDFRKAKDFENFIANLSKTTKEN